MKYEKINLVGILRLNFILLVITIISGCDPYYGVLRTVEVDYLVNHSCIEEALDQVSEVREVEYRYSEGQPRLTSSGWSQPDQYHSYSYTTNWVHGSIFLQIIQGERIEISHGHGGVLLRPPQEEIDFILPILKKIEGSLGETCGIDNIETKVSELCRAVECD